MKASNEHRIIEAKFTEVPTEDLHATIAAQNALVNVNGRICGPGEAQVAVFDRGYLYGDSLYEVVRSFQGKFIYMEEHLKRLAESAGLARMVLGQPLELYQKEMERTFAEFRKRPGQTKTDVYCRLIVSRGAGKIGFGLGALMTPSQFSIIVQPLDLPTEQQLQKGLCLQVVERLRNDPRALDPAMKSGNYLNSLLAFLEATAENYDDALMANAEGHLTEGTTFNIFYVKRGIIVTPPLDIGILDGITRRELLRIARELGMETREVRFPKERLYEADEVFLSSTTKDAFPITRVDGKTIATGKPGPVTLKLRQAIQREYERRIGNAG